MKKPTICILLPFYNEAQCLNSTLLACIAYAKENSNVSFIFINDGSQDDSVRIVEQFTQEHSFIVLINNKMNKGKKLAIMDGLQQAYSDYVIYMDSDMAYSFNHIDLMLAQFEQGAEVVLGNRNLTQNKNRYAVRAALGETFNFMVRVILGLPYKDTQAGIKGFKTCAAKKIFEKSKIHDFSFDAELLFLAKKYKYTIAEIPARVATHHSYATTKLNLVQDSMKMFFSIFNIRINNLLGSYNDK